jgi:transposase InsO family protein
LVGRAIERNVAIEPPNHVWSTNFTYIPMRGGFLYLVAVMEWFSRYVETKRGGVRLR